MLGSAAASPPSGRACARWSCGRPSKDTWLGVDMVRNLAVVYVMLGEADSAVQQLRVLLSVPSWISVPGLRADPTWDPIRRDPGFQALLKRGR